MTESEEKLKSLLMKVKEKRENAGLKLNIQKTKIMASSPITSWQIDGGKVETVTDFIFLSSRICAVCDCSHKISKPTPWEKSYDKHSALKRRDIILPTNVHIVKPMDFPVVMYRYESWTMKKAEWKELIVSNCSAGEDS